MPLTVATSMKREMLLDEYRDAFDSLQGKVDASSFPPHFFRPEYRGVKLEATLPPKPKNIVYSPPPPPPPLEPPKEKASKARAFVKRDKTESLEKDLPFKAAGFSTYTRGLPFDPKVVGIPFDEKDVIMVESIFQVGVAALEIYRNPFGNIQDDKFTSESFTHSICKALGASLQTSVPTEDEFSGIKEMGAYVGERLGRINFRIAGSGDLLIMPNDAIPFLALSVPQSVNCTIRFGEEEIEGISYEKIDVFLKKGHGTKYVNAIRFALNELTNKSLESVCA